MNPSEELAALVALGRGGARIRSAFGVVTALAGDSVYVRPDSKSTGTMGPIYVVTGKAAVDDRVLLTFLPEQDVWVAWAKVVATTTDVAAIWVLNIGGAFDMRIDAMFRQSGVWTARSAVHSFTDSNFPFDLPFGVADRSDPTITAAELIASWSQPSSIKPTGKAHVYPMADGGIVAMNSRDQDLGSDGGIYVNVRTPAGAWSRTQLRAGAAVGAASLSGFARDIDTLYGIVQESSGGQRYLAKVAYSGGSIVRSTVNISTIADSWSQAHPYYDSANGLLHVSYTKTGVTKLGAFRVSDFGLAYEITLSPAGFTAGDGGAEFFSCVVSGGVLLVRRLFAGPASYTSGPTTESGVPVPTLGTLRSTVIVWNGQLEIFLASGTGTWDHQSLVRLGQDSYGAWTSYATAVPSPYVFGLMPNLASGEKARVLWVDTVGGTPYKLRDMTVGP